MINRWVPPNTNRPVLLGPSPWQKERCCRRLIQQRRTNVDEEDQCPVHIILYMSKELNKVREEYNVHPELKCHGRENKTREATWQGRNPQGIE